MGATPFTVKPWSVCSGAPPRMAGGDATDDTDALQAATGHMEVRVAPWNDEERFPGRQLVRQRLLPSKRVQRLAAVITVLAFCLALCTSMDAVSNRAWTKPFLEWEER